jgi:hypothetical protein
MQASETLQALAKSAVHAYLTAILPGPDDRAS